MHLPQLKAVALLGAMLLFKPILDKENVLAKHLVFCERHPLIDTSIYASFYAQKLSPGSIDVAVLTTIERKYAKGFSAIKNYVPSIIHTSGMGICEAFMAFIYDWFHIKNRTSVLDLQEIFKVNLPNKVFYLKASPEFLFNRIKDRKLKEAHESYEVFVKLENVYQALFLSLNEQKEDLVALVNAESAEDMDAFSLKLKRGDI
jgi:hypothetical protein